MQELPPRALNGSAYAQLFFQYPHRARYAVEIVNGGNFCYHSWEWVLHLEFIVEGR